MMIRMKKALCSVILCLVFAISVYAENEIKILYSGNNISFEATVESDEAVAVRVAKKNSNLSDSANILLVKNIIPQNGKVKAELFIPDERNGIPNDGEYSVVFKQKNKNQISKDFVFVNSQNRNDAVNKLALSDAPEKLLEKESPEYNALISAGVDIERYEAVSSKSDVVSIFKSSLTPGGNIKSIFNNSIYLSYINEGRIIPCMSLINPVFEDKAYADFDSERSKWSDECILRGKPYSSVEEFLIEYRQCNELYEINHARFDKIAGLTDKYADDLGISNNASYISYKELSSAKRTAISEKLVEMLGTNSAENGDELATMIKRAVDSVKDDGRTSYGGGGGDTTLGGKSSKSGDGSFVPTLSSVSTAQNDKKTEIEFSDTVAVPWAEQAIYTLVDKNIISGYPDGTFLPNSPIKREEFIKVIVSVYDCYDNTAECEFDDVLKDSWYYRYVASAVKNSIVAGIDYNMFGSGRDISRQDMAVIIYRASKKWETLKKCEYSSFNDEYEISDYAFDAIKTLYEAGLITGDDIGRYNPLNNATRAEVAVLVYRLLQIK